MEQHQQGYDSVLDSASANSAFWSSTHIESEDVRLDPQTEDATGCDSTRTAHPRGTRLPSQPERVDHDEDQLQPTVKSTTEYISRSTRDESLLYNVAASNTEPTILLQDSARADPVFSLSAPTRSEEMRFSHPEHATESTVTHHSSQPEPDGHETDPLEPTVKSKSDYVSVPEKSLLCSEAASDIGLTTLQHDRSNPSTPDQDEVDLLGPRLSRLPQLLRFSRRARSAHCSSLCTSYEAKKVVNWIYKKSYVNVSHSDRTGTNQLVASYVQPAKRGNSNWLFDRYTRGGRQVGDRCTQIEIKSHTASNNRVGVKEPKSGIPLELVDEHTNDQTSYVFTCYEQDNLCALALNDKLIVQVDGSGKLVLGVGNVYYQAHRIFKFESQ